MAADIMSELNSNDLNEFRKDFTELIRVSFGISKEYSKLSKDVDRYLEEFKKIVALFNKKYNGLTLRLKKTTEELRLRIFIKENSVKDVFVNVASKFNGLKAIGVNDFSEAKVEEADKFSKMLDSVKNKLFISYFEQETSGTIFLEYYKEGMVELHYNHGIGDEKNPEFKLCVYYAVKGGIGEVNVYEKLSGIGFVENPVLDKVRKFFKKFNPRIGE